MQLPYPQQQELCDALINNESLDTSQVSIIQHMFLNGNKQRYKPLFSRICYRSGIFVRHNRHWYTRSEFEFSYRLEEDTFSIRNLYVAEKCRQPDIG